MGSTTAHKHGFEWGIVDLEPAQGETWADHEPHEFINQRFDDWYRPAKDYFHCLKSLPNLPTELWADTITGKYHCLPSQDVKHHRHHLNREQHDTPFYAADIEPEVELTGTPTVMFHGMGDACINPGIGQIDKIISKGTGGYVKCIEVGLPSIGEVVNNFETVAEKSCKKVAADKHFAGEFNVMGLSQGGLLARYIAEECDMPGKVRNMLTLGGPHMGVDKLPHCFDGMVCDVVNWVVKKFVYTSLAQDWIAPAGYFRDVKNLHGYETKNVFLPALNNENNQGNGDRAELRKSRMLDLNAAMFVMFSEDTMVYPKESEWFQQVDKKGNLLALNETDFYNSDYIGLKTLNEAGKVTFGKVEGDHLQFTEDDITNTFIPFLMK